MGEIWDWGFGIGDWGLGGNSLLIFRLIISVYLTKGMPGYAGQTTRGGEHLVLDKCKHGGKIVWMTRPRHPDKHIEKAIRSAEQLGWTVEVSGGHAWGRLFCPHHSPDGCIVIVYSTPRVPENHARHIQREIDLCPHSQGNRTATSESKP
jgi:hypothetical protein